MLTQCVTETGSKSALSRLDSLHKQTSCDYNNFIFTVKTSGIPREMEHLPVCYAVSHWCWSWEPTAHLPIQSRLLQTVKPQGVQTKRQCTAKQSSFWESAALPVQLPAPSARVGRAPSGNAHQTTHPCTQRGQCAYGGVGSQGSPGNCRPHKAHTSSCKVMAVSAPSWHIPPHPAHRTHTSTESFGLVGLLCSVLGLYKKS